MTGIAGCCGPASTDQLRRNAESALNAMVAYGTMAFAFDAVRGAVFGIQQSPLAQPDGPAPPVTLTERYLCVADARIDNRAELARELAIDGQVSDGRLILAAWLKWYQDAPARLLGDFAFAIFDSEQQALHLARDPSGERPLFYASAAGHLHFATMPAALIAHPALWRGWNSAVLGAAQLGAKSVDGATYFAGINQLYPGECLTLANGQVTAQSKWSPATSPCHSRTDDDYIEEYRHLLDASVGCRMRRPWGRLAAHLSSGWDSSAVATTATRLADPGDPPLIALTSAPRLDFRPHPSLRLTVDESELAGVTARAGGMEHVVVRTADSALSMLREHSRFYQEPNRNIVNSVWYANVTQAARDRGASVILCGQSGNLTLNRGGVASFAEFIDQRRWRRWWHEASRAARIGEVRWTGILYNSFWSQLPRRGRQWLLQRRFGLVAHEAFHFLRAEHVPAALERVRSSEAEHERGSDRDQRLRHLARFDHGLFRKGLLAAYGVDERDPTGDQRLIRFGLDLPAEQMLRDGVMRPMARRALSDRVPAEILANPRRGTQGANWFETIRKGDAADLIDEVASNATVAGLFDLPRLRRMIDDWPAADDGSFGLAQRYQQKLPLALSTAIFIIEMERLAGRGVA